MYLSGWEAKQISQLKAAGLMDPRLGKPAPRRVPAAEAEPVAELYRTRHGGFTAKHFHERLVGVHGFSWGYTWTKTDNTVIWHRRRLQIPASPLRPHFVRARVNVRQHLDGTLSIFHGPRCIARYGTDGQILDLAT